MINDYKSHSKYLIAAILIVPVFMAFYAYLFFETTPTKKNLASAQDNQVAGASDTLNIEEISKIIPIMPGTEISSLTTSNQDITLILESKDAESQVKTFYEDFFFKNNWQQIDRNNYQKGLKAIEMEISENIIKVQIKNLK